MDAHLTDLQRRCLEMGRDNRLAEGLPPLKYVVHFDDERRRRKWETGSPEWRDWAEQVAALGCCDDRHVWKIGDESSYGRWRQHVIDVAVCFAGADYASLEAMDAARARASCSASMASSDA